MATGASLKGGQRMTSALQRMAKQFGKDAGLRVGFLEGAKYEDGTPIAQVAFWQEFGNTRIPPRPFFRPMIEREKDGWGPLLARVLPRVDYDIEAAMHILGGQIAGQLTESIVVTQQRPLSDVTLMLRKMRDDSGGKLRVTARTVAEAARRVAAGEVGATGTRAKPLIDTGQMQRATGYEVVAK